MMVRNPIYPGFKWRQAFDFPENFFQDGDTVRAEFRRTVRDKILASIDGGSAAEIEGGRLFVELSESQTEAIADHLTQ